MKRKAYGRDFGLSARMSLTMFLLGLLYVGFALVLFYVLHTSTVVLIVIVVGLAFFQQQMSHGGKFTVLMAGALISILPLLIVFFFAQKQFIEGISLSGLKR